MNGSSLFDSSSEESRRGVEARDGGHSSEDSLAARLHAEFDAPVGLLDVRAAAWSARVGLDVARFPSADACLTAALGRGIIGHGRAFVWRPSRPDGPCWLLIPVAHESTELVAVVGFESPESDRPADSALGRPCPERALRAWGQSVADELRGELFPRRSSVAARVDGGERMLVPRLIRRMRMTESPAQFQDLALRAVKATLDLESVAWVPAHEGEAVVVVGESSGILRDDYRDLASLVGGEPILVHNQPLDDSLPEIRRFAVVAADHKAPCGCIVVLNPLDQRALGSAEIELIQPIASLVANHRANWKLYRDLRDMLFGVIRSLTEAIDAKDPYTKGHSQRVARIAVKLAETLGLDAHQRGDIYLMGLLHDVGKIGIKDDVLKKTGQLEEHEYIEIKKHVIIGVEILKGLTKLQHVLPAVRHHHENYDGSGYPDALIGDAIPFEARLLAVADAFDAMASDRPYRKGLTDHRMQKIFRDGSGGQWDPEVVDALFDCWNDVAQITGLPSNGSLEAAVGQVMSGPASGRRR